MNKIQALDSFWNSFGLKAFDENTVPEYIIDDEGNKVKLVPPYITYELVDDSFGNRVAQSASLWYRDTSWSGITSKEQQIADYLGRGGRMILYEGGACWVQKSTPWAQRMTDQNDDSIRRIVLNLEVEFMD